MNHIRTITQLSLPVRSIRWSAIAISAAVVLAACSKGEESAQKLDTTASAEKTEVMLTPEQIQTIGLTTTSLTRMALSGVVHVNGNLDVPPQNLVTISAPFGGFLRSTEMLQGKRVRRGEVVAIMENPEYIQMQQDYIDLSSQLELARLDLRRQQDLQKENVNAQKSVQQATSSFQSLEARVQGQKARLKMIGIDADKLVPGHELSSTISLRAPFDGYVTEIGVNIGKYVSPTDVIMKIVDSEHLHAELIVFEKDVLKLKIGQKVRFTLANETQARMATVYLIGREITSQRTVRVHCHLDKEDPNLLPGMFLSADVETGTEQTSVLPQQSVVDFGGKKYVFVVLGEREDGKVAYEMKEVSAGTAQHGFVEVSFSGMSDGLTIVKDGAFDLLSALRNGEEE